MCQHNPWQGLGVKQTVTVISAAEITAGGLAAVAQASNFVAAGANYMAGNNQRMAINLVAGLGGWGVGKLVEGGAGATMAAGRMFNNLSTGQARMAGYSGNLVGSFGGDALKGAAAGACGKLF